MINEWEVDMIDNEEYIMEWSIGACFAKDKTN